MKKAMKTAGVQTQTPLSSVGAVVPTLQRTFIMTSRHGLHARPCALLVRTLRHFTCQVEITADGTVANGASILGLMSLAVGFESKLTFAICGLEAAGAMAAVQRLFETQFDEAYPPNHKPAARLDQTAQIYRHR